MKKNWRRESCCPLMPTSRPDPLISRLNANVVFLYPNKSIRHRRTSRRVEGMLRLPTKHHHHGVTGRQLTALGRPPHTPTLRHHAQAPHLFVM
jgi:hypothetical protein